MNLYQLLGVPYSANKQAIRNAYLQLAKKYHPDRNVGNAEKFKQIKNAYETLFDEEKRRQYDMTLEAFDEVHHQNYSQSNKHYYYSEFAEPEGVTEEFVRYEKDMERRRKMARHLAFMFFVFYIVYRIILYRMLMKRREKILEVREQIGDVTSPVASGHKL
jgi:DnaJ-class molecular chaperone